MTLFSTSGPSKKLSEVIAPFETKRDYTECLKHFLLSVSHERRPTESLLTLAEGVNYGSLQLPCSPLPGRADTCKRTGDPRSQRGLWASTQSKMQKEVFFILLVPFHLNLSALSGWCLHSCPTTITRIFFLILPICSVVKSHIQSGIYGLHPLNDKPWFCYCAAGP